MLKARRQHLLLVVAALWTGAANAIPLPLDSDGDGVLDLLEVTLGTNPFARDTDGDGKPDGEEILLDSDLDLRNNALESSIVDSDHDGFNDENDARDDDACFPDDAVGACDADGDGISNIREWDAGTDHRRRDTDRDGLDDGVEGLVDSDLDGLIDALEANDHDCDADGIPDHLDADSDNDGVEDGDEFPGDSDGDGKHNVCDDDDDGDGIPTLFELLNGFISDRDDDGIPDHLDGDSDGDGVLDGVEGLGDKDGDGVPDLLDFDDSDGPGLDSDGDGEHVGEEIPPAEVPGEEDPAEPEEAGEEVVIDEDVIDEDVIDEDAEAPVDEEQDAEGDVLEEAPRKLDIHVLIGLRANEATDVGDAAAADDDDDDDDDDVGVALDDHGSVDEASASCAAAPAGPGVFVFAGLLALLRRRRR